MSHPKILEQHLKRQAVIYIRQSSLLQVTHHTESQHRQYQLAERAQSLGWPAAHCIIIDDDLGISAAHAHNRPDYQRLITLVALREVGIVFGLDVSRLARNSLDWYQLLELAGNFQVLIADEDGVYDPSDFNDRLLLGLKGTISEAELYQIRARMVRGQRTKAQRGELALRLPVGLDYDPLTHTIQVAVDQSVRHAVEQVFTRFRQLRSVRGVLHALVRDGLELSYQHLDHLGRTIAWHAPTYDAIYLMVTNPSYAGVYSYGRRQREQDRLAHTTRYRRRCREDWLVFIPDHHPGYISLVEFDTNQAILENNRMQYPASQGAAGRGPALLQGLVICHHCGQRMRVRYRRNAPYYVCVQAHRRRAAPICNRASVQRVDALVEELFLSVVNQETLDASLSYDQQLRAEAEVVDRAWQDKLQRLHYQADLARRRYELVDPANRLVAQTLETEWNARLVELEQAQHAYAAHRLTLEALQSTPAQLKQVVSHLRDYWYAATITDQQRSRWQ
jgi:DNA invertase Pin-like site-specific DNA recombinase